MKGTRHNEEQIIAIPEAGRSGIERSGDQPTKRNHQTDVLPLEGQVWRNGQR
jgi:hypothetical protein